MMNSDFEIENTQLLLARWERLREGAIPASVGFDTHAGASLAALDRCQVIRAATVHVPLFSLIPNDEVLENALELDSPPSKLDGDLFLFLVNRWRATAGSFQLAELTYGMSQRLYQLLKTTSLPKIQAAASAGVDFLSVAVRAPYFTHAGQRFDLETSHRTRLAICNSLKMGY